MQQRAGSSPLPSTHPMEEGRRLPSGGPMPRPTLSSPCQLIHTFLLPRRWCQEAFRAAPWLQTHLLWAPNRTQRSGRANCCQTTMIASCFNFWRALTERRTVLLNLDYYKYLRETAQLGSELLWKQFLHWYSRTEAHWPSRFSDRLSAGWHELMVVKEHDGRQRAVLGRAAQVSTTQWKCKPTSVKFLHP